MSNRKFGKQIQKRQLEVPEYAASFVNYKALKKVCLIARLDHRPLTPLLRSFRFEIAMMLGISLPQVSAIIIKTANA